MILCYFIKTRIQKNEYVYIWFDLILRQLSIRTKCNCCCNIAKSIIKYQLERLVLCSTLFRYTNKYNITKLWLAIKWCLYCIVRRTNYDANSPILLPFYFLYYYPQIGKLVLLWFSAYSQIHLCLTFFKLFIIQYDSSYFTIILVCLLFNTNISF